ncbi:MAG: hypothetical protein KatS3mg087_0813 [Patescibacteria group bacterium]|nr:MAG: hypothetical protein KatS3mg087_0813 [Patescibacteria group bacterium]
MKFKVFLIATSSVLTGLICLFLFLGNSIKPQTNTPTQHEGLVISTQGQGEVLQATDSNRPEGNIVFNVPSIFNQVTTFRDDIEAPGQNINLAEGEITASNVIYSLTPGEGITITGGQNATISATAGITSVQNEIGDITFTAADGLSIDGLAFTNTDRGSSQNIFKTFRVNGQSDITAGSNSDTFEFIAGSGINLSTDASAKKLTITSASATQVWQESGSNVSLVTSSNNVGIGTSSPTEKLQVIGNTNVSGNLIVGGSATINGNTYTNFAGDGLALNSGNVNINLTTSGNTGATSSNSGLEVSASGISLLKGCANNELLKWNDGSSVWECATDAGGTSGIISIEEGDSLVSNTAGTLDLNAGDFTVTESPTGEVNIGIDYANSAITRNDQDESIVGNWSYLNNVIIDGSADEIQLLVQGNASQTAHILTIENSSGTDLFTIDPSGNADIAGALNVGTSNAFQINSTGEITSAAGLSSSGNLTFTGSGTYTLTNIAGGASFSNNRIVTTNSAGILSTIPDGSTNQVLTTNGSGVLSWTSIGTILEPTNAFILGGNSFSANATLGTNDNFPLTFETNGLPRTTITNTGNFGIGDTTPASLFTVGSGDLFQVDSSGSITAVVNITASGTVDINGNLAIADTVILLDAASAQTILATGGDLQLGADNDNTNLLTLSSDGTNLTIGTTDGANLIIDTAGSLTVADAATFNGRVVISHGSNQGLRLPTNAGTPSSVTGTSEGDIVYDSTNDALYVYDGAAFQQIGGGAYAGWTISDGTTSQSISSGNTLTVNDSTTVNATVSATDTLTLNVIADSLDFTEFSDSLSLDAATTISLGANALTLNANGAANAIINLSSTGDFVIQDNGTDFATFTDSGVFQIDSLNLDGTTIGLTTDTNLLSLADNALTVNGSITTGAASITDGIDNNNGGITETGSIAGATDITASGTVDINGNLAIADTVILLDAASAQTILATGGDLQLGADNDNTNLLTLSSDGTNLTIGTTDGANLIIDTAGSLTVADAATFNGRVVISHGSNQGLRLPTNAGTPSSVTGTSEGDIVYDSTNDALYVYDGAAFQQIGGGAYAGWTISDGTTSQSISSGNTLTVNDSTTVNATVSATDTLTLNVIADSLDFTEFSDSLSLDAATTISLGANALTLNANGAANAIINLSSTGDFVIQDNGTDFATFTDSGVFQIDSLNLDGTTIGLTTDTNLLSLADNALTVNGSITTGAASITDGIDNNNGGITETGSIAGATDITASGTVDINGNLAIADTVILLDAASAQTILATGGDLQLGADNDNTNLLTLSSDGTNLTIGTTDGANLIIDTAGSLTVADAATFNAGLTLAAGQNITINSESFDDLTGIGLQRNIDGSLETTLGTSITGSEITDNTIEEVDLEVTNSGTDGYILSFDSATGGFTWISNDGGSGASKWSTGSTVTYLTNTSADLTLGAGDTATAPFFFDVSANLLRIGDGANDANDPSIVFYASDATNSGTLSFDDNDDFVFTGGDVNFTGGILGAGLSDCDASSSKLLWDNSTNQFSCGTDAGSGSGASKWTEAGGLTYLTTTGNAVTIGSSTELAKLAIDGDTAGEISFLIQAAAAQTANTMVIENSSGTDLFVIDSSGNIDVGTWTATAIGAQYGGTGDDTSATTGVPYISTGNWQYESALALSRGGTGASLTDPNADRILFWDDSAGTSEWLTIGTGLTLSGTTLTHEDTSSQASSDNSGTTVIQDILLDSMGHITGISTVNLSSSFDNYQSWTVDGDDAHTRTISSTETLIFTGGTGIDTDVNASADEITFNLDLTEINGNQTFGDGTSNATATWTIGLSGATDPTIGFANNAITLTAGSVAVVGNLDVSGTFTSGTADAFQINSSGAITSGTWTATAIGAQYGGTGDDTSATTGVPYISTGNWQYESALALSRGGTGASLTDPNADRILFWDDSAGTSEWLTIGTGLTLSGTTLTHEDTSSQASSDNSGTTVIQDILLDSMGHITGISTVNLSSSFDNYQSWTVDGDDAHTRTISSTETLIFTGGTGIDTDVNASADEITFNLDLTEINGNQTFGDGTSNATATWTIGLSGATDPTIGFANNAITLTAGSVAVVGNLDVSGTFTSGTADAFQINSSGAITSGTWNGTVISAAYGGTGISSYTAGDLLYASAGTTISKLAVGSPGEVLTVSGGNLPYWATPGVAFNNITSGTNTTAAMIVGTGSSLNYEDSGTINASSLQNATWTAPGTIGTTTPNSGAFTSLSSTGITTLSSGAGVATTIGNATGTFQLISNTIDISTGGDISGATGFSSSGNLNFTGSGTYRLSNIAGGATFSNNRIVVTDQDGDLSTIADGSSNEVLTTNGSGLLTWSTVAGLIAADSLDFDDFADTMTLDASTTIAFGGTVTDYGLTINNNGSSNFTINLSDDGDMVIQDNGSARFTFNDSGNLDVASTAYIGIGSSAGRIVFTDSATDEIDVQTANLDMNSNLILNIGNSGTDFDSSGGLTLAGDLTVSSGNILSSATANLLNATSTTINFAGAATLLNIGDSSTTKTIDIGGVSNSGTDTINIATNGTAADIITIGNNNASTTMILTGGDDWSISSAGTFTGENLVLSSATTTTAAFTRSSSGQWISFNDGVDVWGLYNTAGSPEGVLTANTGALSMDTTNGTLYVKTDDGDNTGWVNLATGSSSPFTDGGTITYLTDTAEDFAVGATNSLTAPFSVDVSTNTVRIGSGATANGTLNMYASDGDTGSIAYTTSDGWSFTGGTITSDSTITASDFICTDCLDFTELSDTLALDANTTITQDGSEALEFVNNGTSNTIIDLQSTGDFVIQDNDTDFFTISDTRVITYDYNGTTTTAFNFNANSLTTGNGLDISANGLTSGNAFEIASTSTVLTSGRLANIDWSPGSATTATGDLLRINIGANGNVGNLFNITDNGSTLFSVSESSISANLPTSFNAAGDVSIANDLVMTNQTASYIKSNGPLTIEAGESFENNNLTLKTYGTGDIALDFASSGDLIVGASNSAGTNIGGNGILAYGAICADDTVDNADDCIDAARSAGTVYGIASSFTIDDIAENFPTADGSIEGADIVAFEYKAPGNNLNDPFEYAYETEFVAKGTPTNATNILGVVSAKPGITLGGWGQRKDPRSAQEVAVALSGRVPVKITSENGNINPGDLITISQTKPGVGMKSTNPSDTIIGKALDKYTSIDINQIGTVLIFVNTQWSRESASLAGATTVANNPNGTSGSQAILADAIIYNTVLGTLTFKEDATFQGTATFEQLTQFFGKTEFNGEVSFTKTPSFPNQMAGYTSIKTGETKVTIKFSKPFKVEPVITVSPLDNSIPYTVTQRNESGFTIELDSPASQPTMFSWIALPIN